MFLSAPYAGAVSTLDALTIEGETINPAQLAIDVWQRASKSK